MESSCPAAVDLPLEVRSWRAGLGEHSSHAAAASSPTCGREQDHHPDNCSHKHNWEHSHGHSKKQTSKGAFQPMQGFACSPVEISGQEDKQLQILIAIHGLTDRMARMKACSQSKASSKEHFSGGISPTHLPLCQEPTAVYPDSIPLYVQGSLFKEDG